ncbi:glycosyltransferase, partial [candidate division KSB1 bacterium]
NSQNLGFATAVNQGLHAAKGRYYVILNNDVVVTKNWLERFRETADKYVNFGVFGPMTNYIGSDQMIKEVGYSNLDQMVDYSEKRWQKYGSTLYQYLSLRGFCLFIRSEVVDNIGGFDERFRIGNYEDDDFCLRADAAGFRCGYIEGIYVHHHGSVTFKSLKKDYREILDENAKKFFDKWNITPSEREDLTKSEKEVNSREDITGVDSNLTNDNLKEMLDEGNRLISENNIDEGVKRYRNILEYDQEHLEARHNLNAIIYYTGNKKDAKKALYKIVEDNPSYPDVYLTLALIEENEKNNKKALGLLKKCIEYDVSNEKAYDHYERIAEIEKIQIKDKTADFVFYTGGMPFDGNTIKEKGLGGSESALYHISRILASKGFSVKIFNNCDNPGIYDEVEYGTLTDFYLYFRWNSCKVFISSRSLKPFLSKINSDKKVLWLHDMPDVFFVESFDLNSVDLSEITFFTLSEFQTAEWAKYLNIGKDRFFLTRNGYSPDRFTDKNIRRDSNKLIYSSRPNRGLDILLDVFPAIRDEKPDAELHVFTYTPTKEDHELNEVMKKLDQPGVFFRGSVSQDELAEEIMSSCLMVYPSTFKETSCITAIESQAAGTPIVTANIGALPETVQDGVGGVVIDEDMNSDEGKRLFVKEILDLMNDKKMWKTLSKSGKDRAEKIFTWEKIAEEWIFNLFGKKKSEEIIKPSGYPRLTLCMIVKNEENTLPVCLDSVKELVDEIVVVDTGSEDDTVKIAEKYGAVIKHFEWIDDFSAARNESLKYASGDWILYLDADERISPGNAQKIRDIIEDESIAAVNMIEHIPQEKGNLFNTTASDYCRLFRNNNKYRFSGRIHEQILPSILNEGCRVVKSDITIDHWGFGLTPEKKKERADRNLKLLQEELKDDSNDPFVHF